MPSTNNFKKPNFKYKHIPQRLQRRQETIARTVYKPRFERLVEPFESKIEFGTETEITSNSIDTLIGPLPVPTGKTNAAGDIVLGSEIWKWLDDGTDKRFAKMPNNFSNESSPNSLNTSHKEYNRARIYLDQENAARGIDARNFSELVSLELQNVYLQRINNELRKSVNEL